MEIVKTTYFTTWIESLKDPIIRYRIASRIDRLGYGLFGDSKPVGGGVSELRLKFGAGYRIYYVVRGKQIVILLVGGDKSTQRKDIVKAKKIAEELE